MNNRLFFLLVFCFVQSWSYAQVGVNTTNPSATVHIETLPTNVPNLQLQPQAVPVGTATGQLAVIGDELYMYDAVRTKWLSVGFSSLDFGRNANSDNQPLRFGGNAEDDDTGAMMPFDGTIIAIGAKASDGVANKGFEVRVRNGNGAAANQATLNLNLAGGEYQSNNNNLDFDAGDYLSVYVVNAGGNIENLAVTLWIKKRAN